VWGRNEALELEEARGDVSMRFFRFVSSGVAERGDCTECGCVFDLAGIVGVEELLPLEGSTSLELVSVGGLLMALGLICTAGGEDLGALAISLVMVETLSDFVNLERFDSVDVLLGACEEGTAAVVVELDDEVEDEEDSLLFALREKETPMFVFGSVTLLVDLFFLFFASVSASSVSERYFLSFLASTARSEDIVE